MDLFYVCGFCKARLSGAETVTQLLGGRTVYFCPHCKGPCRVEDAHAPSTPPALSLKSRNPTDPVPVEIVPPPLPSPATPHVSSLRLKHVEGAAKPGDELSGSDAPVELIQRVQNHVAMVEQRRIDREARIKKNPWAAFFFPLKPLSLLAILMMITVFSGIGILMDIGLADDAPKKSAKKNQESQRAPTAILKSNVKSGEIRVKSGGKTKVLATTEDVGSEPNDFGDLLDSVGSPDYEGKIYEDDLLQSYRYSGPYDRSRFDRETGEFKPDSEGGGFDFILPGLIALGLTSLLTRAFVLMYFAAMLLNLIYETSIGTDHFPRWPNPLDVVDSFLVPAYQFLFCLVISFLPGLVAFIAPFYFPHFLLFVWLSAPFLLLFGLLYFPMALMCVAVRGEWASALPSVVLPALFKAHIHYLPVMIAFLLVPLWPWISGYFWGDILKSWQLILIDSAMHFTLLVVVTRALGLLYRRIETKLNWTAFARA